MPTCPRKKISHQEHCVMKVVICCASNCCLTQHLRDKHLFHADALYYLTHRNMHISKEDITSEIIIMLHVAVIQQNIYSVSCYNKCVVLTRSLHGITNYFPCYYALIFSLLLYTK